MPKFHVSVERGVARRETVEVTADSPEEARWLALSASDGWKDAETRVVSVIPAPHTAVPVEKTLALRSAA